MSNLLVDMPFHGRRESKLEHIVLENNWNYTEAHRNVTAAKKRLAVGGKLEIQFPGKDWRNLVLIENTLPVHACVREDTTCTWTFGLSSEIKQVKIIEDDKHDHVLFVGCSCAPKEFANVAITSVMESKPNVLLLDALHEPYDWSIFTWYDSATILKLPPAFRFTAIMNVAFTWALMKDYEFVGFMHADSEARDHLIWEKLLKYGKEDRDKRAGVWYTHYDVLALFRAQAIMDVGFWDESFIHYKSDNDYYRRYDLAGWHRPNAPFNEINHYGSYTIKHCREKQQEHASIGGWTNARYHHKWGNEDKRIPYGI
jgi:hypothetical protein